MMARLYRQGEIMKKTMLMITALLSLGLLATDADARRLGGGSNLGTQRSTITQPAPKSPAQQAPSAAPATPAPQPSGMSKWLGPLAGLAIGAGLASLFMNNGMAGAFGGILMVLLLAAAAMFAWRMLRPRPQAGPLQYAGAAAAGGQPDISTAFGGGAGALAAVANRYPPGFDAEQFAHHAKLNFTRLQQANDKRDLSTMRDFMTPELYAEVVADLNARDGAQQQTDVVTLNAEVIEVVTEGEAYVASVRFSGMIRERADGAAEPFSEVWHLEKPITGSIGWLICGIQQD
jgi:predicted lipid-binding transport protein (Tim44 family)